MGTFIIALCLSFALGYYVNSLNCYAFDMSSATKSAEWVMDSYDTLYMTIDGDRPFLNSIGISNTPLDDMKATVTDWIKEYKRYKPPSELLLGVLLNKVCTAR